MALIEGRHILVVDTDGVAVQNDGKLVAMDKADNSVILLERCPEVLDFFGLFECELEEVPASTPCSKPTSINASCSSSTPPGLQSRSKKHRLWVDDDSVRCLIHLRHVTLAGLFEATSTMTRPEAWSRLANDMKPHWFMTGEQCHNKYKEIKKQYMNDKENMGPKASGRPTVTSCRFFNELDEFLCNKPTVKPPGLAYSLKRATDEEDSGGSSKKSCREVEGGKREEEEDDDDDLGKEESVGAKLSQKFIQKKIEKKEKNKANSSKSRLDKQLVELTNNLKQHCDEREKKSDERFEKLFANQERAIHVFQESFKQLMDKL